MRPLTLLALVASVASLAGAGRAATQDTPVVAGSDGVPAPKKVRYVEPEYPPEAIEKGLRGIVILELVIDKTGKVASADVIRSVPPFDEAALAAVRQWEYEITKVDGKPVSVRLPVPITFSMKLPEVARQSGIPELRQGASPRYPLRAKGTDSGRVMAEVSLHPDGTVAEAQVMKGDSPWAEELLRALNTWRFAPDTTGGLVSFRVEAEFMGGNPPRVALRLSGLRRVEAESAAASAPPPPQEPTSPPAVTPPAVAPAPAAPSSPPAVPPVPASDAPTTTPAPGPTAAPTEQKPPSGAPASPAATAPPPVQAPEPAPAPPPNPPSASPKPPVEEVITGTPEQAAASAPPAEPAVVGVSAIRDVTLSEGVPDLAKGRRPVTPPLARMGETEGTVEVRFSVDASGGTSLQGSSGPEVLRAAADAVVGSWGFRRTTARRIYLVAQLTYKVDSATAAVRLQE